VGWRVGGLAESSMYFTADAMSFFNVLFPCSQRSTLQLTRWVVWLMGRHVFSRFSSFFQAIAMAGVAAEFMQNVFFQVLFHYNQRCNFLVIYADTFN
jgi:hypothetical protein